MATDKYTIQKTVRLGGTAKDVVVAKTGHGLMMMTWKPTPVPDEEAFAAMRAGMDALPPGVKMMLNSAEFYGVNPREANLELLARFFEKYPEYVDKAFLSVKGGAGRETLRPDSSPENLRRSVDAINAKLRGTKRMDLFETARIPPTNPIEANMRALKQLVEEGKFDHIGLSECGANTVRRANAVVPIAAVEIEVSPWSYEQETENVIATCEELEIPVVAYSPLGRGFLTGAVTKPEDFEEGDFRRTLTRFKDENMKANAALVAALKQVAADKGVTPAQLSLAWVASRGEHVIPLPGSSKAARTLENLRGGDLELTPAELAAVEDVRKTIPVQGGRYIDEWGDKALMHWA
ncbi:aldo/keto reductase [Dentipellis sp. KUC8613]|nr:aldo/keto reductase [Dentipellis sp. KUC8613]